MKATLLSSDSRRTRIAVIFIFLTAGFLLCSTNASAQIYEPEGLNMPGAWNAWTNPPSNNLALASAMQVPGGKVTRIAEGTPRYQTTFSVAATGGDLTAGTYEWLFTSGASSNYYQNKWSAVTVVMDTLQLYTKEGAANNSITLEDGKWYTMNWEDIGYADTRAIFMKTSAMPVEFMMVSVPVSVTANTPATISIGLNAGNSPEENIYIRYSADAWVTSAVVLATMTGMSGTAVIPGQPGGTVVSYYAFSSTLENITADFDLKTLRYHNNNGTNYTYTVGAAPATITFANLQWPPVGSVSQGMAFDVYGRVEIPGITGQTTPAPGLEAWVGYNNVNTDPSTWINWKVAVYNSAFAGQDEFVANIGPEITGVGTYYYATRYRYEAGTYVYGGYSGSGGGFWNGINNISGVVDVVMGIAREYHTTALVYPNPTNGLVFIDVPEKTTIQLTDALGRIVLTKQVLAGHQSIDITGFSKGVYHLKTVDGTRPVHQTILKH